VTRGTIEERVLRTLEQKQGLFAGLFDGDEDEVTFTNIATGTLLKAVTDLLAEPKPATEPKAGSSTVVGGAEVWAAAAAFLESLAAGEARPPAEVDERIKAAMRKLEMKLNDPSRGKQ
jgi:hypothetical protein